MIYVYAALLTAILETYFFFVLYKENLFLAFVFVVNLLTNTTVNFLMLLVYQQGIAEVPATLVLETGVVVCEWLMLYSYLPKSRPLGRTSFFFLVFLSNLLSYTAGLALNCFLL